MLAMLSTLAPGRADASSHPSPRGSDADLSIVGYVVRGFHDESLPSRHAS